VPSPVAAEVQPDLSKLHIGRRDAEQNAPLEYLAAMPKGGARAQPLHDGRDEAAAGHRRVRPHFVLIAAKHIRRTSSDGGIPDDDRRKDILDTTAIVLGYLIDSYKVALKKLYGDAGRRQMRRDMERARAFRILELTKLQQRVLGLRYQVLAGPAWLTVNTVYHAMRAAGRAERRFRLLETELIEDHDSKRSRSPTCSSRVHMVARFDILRWPTEMHQLSSSTASRWPARASCRKTTARRSPAQVGRVLLRHAPGADRTRGRGFRARPRRW
jgi:hypothetical protein